MLAPLALRPCPDLFRLRAAYDLILVLDSGRIGNEMVNRVVHEGVSAATRLYQRPPAPGRVGTSFAESAADHQAE